jgi:hypothetical protein
MKNEEISLTQEDSAREENKKSEPTGHIWRHGLFSRFPNVFKKNNTSDKPVTEIVPDNFLPKKSGEPIVGDIKIERLPVSGNGTYSKLVFSKDSEIDVFLQKVEITNPKFAAYLRHYFDDRLYFLKSNLDVTITKEEENLEKRQQDYDAYYSAKQARLKADLDALKAELAFEYKSEKDNFAKLIEADEQACINAAKAGVYFAPKPRIIISSLEKSVNQTEVESDPEGNTDKSTTKKKESIKNFFIRIKDGAAEFFSRDQDSELAEKIENKSQVIDELHWDRITRNNLIWLFRRMTPIMHLEGIAAENNLPYYFSEEVYLKDHLKREEEPMDSAANPLAHRRLRAPLIPTPLFHLCTVAVGVIISLSIAISFSANLDFGKDISEIGGFLAKLGPFLPFGIAVAYASRYSVTLPFLFAGENHALVTYCNPPNKDELLAIGRKFTTVGIIIFFAVLLTDYAMEYSGVVRFLSKEGEKLIRIQKPWFITLAQYIAPLVVLTGYLIYCAFEGFLRGRDAILYNKTAYLWQKRIEEQNVKAGFTPDVAVKALESINLYLSKHRTLIAIEDRIEKLRDQVKENVSAIEKIKMTLSFDLDAKQRISVALHTLIAATNDFDKMVFTAMQLEIEKLHNEVRELEKQREQINKDIAILNDSIEKEKEIIAAQHQTSIDKEDLNRAFVGLQQYQAEKYKSVIDANGRVDVLNVETAIEKLNCEIETQKAKCATEQLKEEVNQGKVKIELLEIENQLREIDPNYKKKSILQRIVEFFQSLFKKKETDKK